MIYRMAAYCRLSKDDGENKVSESIENQLKLIREYAAGSADLEIAGIYIDDGYSGLYFYNRPEFRRMMDDIRRGIIQGVITKDISRLGREHIDTSNYIERIFPSLGIRYIAVLDGVDTLLHSNEELAQFKTLFNDMYSRDISRKIRGALSVQKKRGQFTAGFAPYGYIRDPADKHHFLVDGEAAEVVRRIFSLYLEGYSRDGIAKKLNREGVLTPSEYKRKVQKLRYCNPREKEGKGGWSYPTVNMILRNRVYTGAMVQHKSEKISYKMQKYRCIPEEQQYIVEGMHEAVISADVFEQVQEMMKKRTRTPGQTARVSPYSGILVCGDCGHSFHRVTCRDGYECGAYHKKGNTLCFSHFIRKETLDSILKKEIRRQMKTALGEEEREEILRMVCGQKSTGTGSGYEGQRQRELERVRKYKRKTYENYADGILDAEEYVFYKQQYEKEEQEIIEKIMNAQIIRKKEEKKERESRTRMEEFIKSGELPEITREAVAELIERITVNGDGSMDIVFRTASPYV